MADLVVGCRSLELTFSSKLLRDLATEPTEAYDKLGSENGQAFIGLVGDFRAAQFANDVPGGPISACSVGSNFELIWAISNSCTLKTLVVTISSGTDHWKDAHRIHLDSIIIDKEVVA
jgi:hypothetical protein